MKVYIQCDAGYVLLKVSAHANKKGGKCAQVLIALQGSGIEFSLKREMKLDYLLNEKNTIVWLLLLKAPFLLHQIIITAPNNKWLGLNMSRVRLPTLGKEVIIVVQSKQRLCTCQQII